MQTTAASLAAALRRRGFAVSADVKFGAQICVIEADPRGRPIGVEVADFGADGFRWNAGENFYIEDSPLIDTRDLTNRVIETLELPEPGQPLHYLSLAEFADRIGVAANSMSRYKLPPPDAIVGAANPDGTLPRGTVRGWLPETVDRWHANRPGRGARTDLYR